MTPLAHLNNDPNHIFVATPYGPGYWVPRGDYVQNTVIRGAKNKGYNNFLKFMKPAARTACDIGANIGEITWALSHFCQHIHAFEPVTDTFKLLEKNVEQNALKNVTAYNQGIGAQHETALITLSSNTCGANARVSDVSKTRSKTETMTIVPLDALNLVDVDIMKIDVEGYELDVLRGAEQTILRDKPIIQLEVYEPALKRARRDIKDIYDWMIKRDFAAYYVKSRKITAEGTEYTRVPKCIERFFVHKSIAVGTEVPKTVRVLE
jgi:FkbM family methyltransferase